MSIFNENETLRILNSLCNVSLDKFDDRLRMQKLGYLVQSLGASGGFTFSWYLRGPYSSSLTKMLYSAEEIGILGKKPSLSHEEKQIIKNLKQLLQNNLDDPRTLELYASVWYLLPKQHVSTDDVDYILETFKTAKPNYSNHEVRKCIDTILHFKNQKVVSIS